MSKSTTRHSPPLTLLETSASYLTNTSLFLARSHLSPNLNCYYHIRQLRCIRPYLDTKTASTIAVSIVPSKLDYCNSLYHNLQCLSLRSPAPTDPELSCTCCCRSSQIQSYHSYLSVSGLLWLKIIERIEYKLLSLTYKSSHNHPTFI